MSVLADRYTTSKFILKDDESEKYIKDLVNLLQDESNLSSGYTFKDYYAKLINYGDKIYKFTAGGYADSGPELKYSAIHKSDNNLNQNDEDENFDEVNSISLFDEIQKNIAKDTWFFVENHCIDHSYFSSYVSFYHQDGRVASRYSDESKKEILKSMKIDGRSE